MPASPKDTQPVESSGQSSPSQWQDVLLKQLRGMSYGVIQLTVHDGRVVQIDCTHRTRLTASNTK